MSYYKFKESTCDVRYDPKTDELCDDNQWDFITDKFIHNLESDEFRTYIINLLDNIVDPNNINLIAYYGFDDDEIYFNLNANYHGFKSGTKLTYKMKYHCKYKKLKNLTTASDIIYTIADAVCYMIDDIYPSHHATCNNSSGIALEIETDQRGWLYIGIR